jgi:predicted nucleic acid-binding protein
MAVLARYLVDKSALARAGETAVAKVFDPLLQSRLLAVSGIIELEVLYSARNGSDHRQMRTQLESAFDWLRTEDEDFVRAVEVQGKLAAIGNHRAVSLADLLIAAVAERNGVAVLHYDADFDVIATQTGQDTQWVVPRGSIN